MPLLRAGTDGSDDGTGRSRARRAAPAARSSRRAEEPSAPVSNSEMLGEKSLEKGYLQDALKYLQIAHENDPLDFDVMLKLGWTYNMLKDDRKRCAGSIWRGAAPTRKIAAEASRAYRNLKSAD